MEIDMFKVPAALFGMFLTVGSAAAEGAPAVTLEGYVKLEKIVQGTKGPLTVLEDPKVVVPGDKLVFWTSYANSGSSQVNDFVVTNPVPQAVRVSDDYANRLVVSVDGGNTFDSLSKLTVQNSDGTVRPASAVDISHIRWKIATIAPGGSGKVEYRAVVR